MLVQRSALEQHRVVVPVSVTKTQLQDGRFSVEFNQHNYRALVDTGAQRTVLSYSVITEQRLVRVGHMQFAGMHGTKTHSRYLASIGLWVQRIDSSPATANPNDAEQTLYSLEEPFEVVDMEDNINFDLILGFDILKSFSFRYSALDQSFELIAKK